MVDGKPTTLEVMLGQIRMADKCYVRVGSDEEFWFKPTSESRDGVLDQGMLILQERLNGHDLKTQSGMPYTWN